MGGMMFTPHVNAWRFYDDSGGEAASNQLEAQDTDHDVDVTAGNVDLQLRFRIDETGGADGATTDDWQLQYNPNGGGFVNHSITDNDGIIAVTAGLVDGNVTTNRSSDPISDPGSGSFVPGEQDDDGLVQDRQLTSGNFTELVYGMRFVLASLTNGDAFDFQISTPTGIVNNVTPGITITIDAGGGGRIMSSLAGHGGLAGSGGMAGSGGGLAGAEHVRYPRLPTRGDHRLQVYDTTIQRWRPYEPIGAQRRSVRRQLDRRDYGF